MTTSGDSPLEKLGEASGRAFDNLVRARELTSEGLAQRQTELGRLPSRADASIVLMGSWGRSEVTTGSDDDFMVLIDGKKRWRVKPSVGSVGKLLDEQPGDQSIFAQPVYCDDLVEKIGLDRDDNTNLSRRMLFLLESVPATNDAVYRTARDRVLQRYLDKSIKDSRPPRFLLNDTVRYWRTICVDFAAKEYEGPQKWGIRNAKLRTSRKILFAGGLMPIFECTWRKADEMFAFMSSQLDMPPTDRIAQSFIEHKSH